MCVRARAREAACVMVTHAVREWCAVFGEDKMPLVIVTGLPCSGKTRRVAELVEFIQTHHSDIEVQVQFQ